MAHFISLKTAVAMTRLYRQEYENILQPPYRGKGILPFAEAFDRAAFDAVLAQDGCAGLRIYYGMDADLKVHAIIVGTDAKGNDLLPQGAARGGAEPEDLIIEKGNRCPDLCSNDSPLNN